jgi:hypothetical protein
MAVTNREAEQWNRMQHWRFRREIERSRQELVERLRHQNQSNTPEGASGCSLAVVSHEGRAVAARGSRAQIDAGQSSALAAVSTTAAACENPGNEHQAPLTGLVAGARLRQAKQIIGQRSLL